MENTLENKARFFAQYWGQKVLTTEKYFPELFEIRRDNKTVSEIHYLQLKPLSSITEEDYQKVYEDKIMNPESPKDEIPITDVFGNMNLSDITTTDFLRSKGYALPYMGISVEDMISYGWIKLKTEDNG